MTLVSVIVPSIGSGGEIRGGHRTFVVEAVRSVLATTGLVTRPFFPAKVMISL